MIDYKGINNHMKLKTDTCDTCSTGGSKKSLVVEFYQLGSPVLAQCRDCNPSGWNMAAEAQKEMWLHGE